MFSIAQIRGLQGAMTALGTTAAAQKTPLYQTLIGTLALEGRELERSRLLSVCTAEAPAVRGLLFRYKDDPEFRAHLTLPDNRRAPLALHLELRKTEQRPTLLGLHYVHGTRRRAVTAYYLLAGALDVYDTPGFEYSKLKRKTHFVEDVSRLVYTLNTPMAALDLYPKGKKLAIVDRLQKIDVHYVGELVSKKPEELQAALGSTYWSTVQSIFRSLRLLPGSTYPQWRAPR